MRELLERWAALQPERLEVGPLGVYLRPPVNSSMAWPEVKHEVIPDGILLAAVIESIEAKRGAWRLARAVNGNISAVVSLDANSHGCNLEPSATPAEALLTAYLAAVEAEK